MVFDQLLFMDGPACPVVRCRNEVVHRCLVLQHHQGHDVATLRQVGRRVQFVGTSSFQTDFVKQGPRDSRGRSLRDFDLQTRLFKYPCSYLIYSESFDQLPVAVKDRVYRRLWEILNGKDRSKAFAQLKKSDGQAILEILKETKTDLPKSWKGTT